MVASDAMTALEPTLAGRPAAAAHWRARLAGLGEKSCPVADLAPAPGAQPATGTHAVRLPAPLVSRLDEMSRHEPTALHVLLVTTLAALLRRHAVGDEVVVGQPTPLGSAGPNRMLPLRIDVALDDTLRSLLMRMRTVAREALEHADCPVAELADELGRAVAAGDNPYFDVAMELVGLHDPGFADSVPVRLLLTAARTDDELELTVRYDATRFLPATAERLARHFVALLERAAAEPDRPLAEIDLRTPADEQVVAASNDTAIAFDEGATLHGLLRRQAALTPDAVAVDGPAGPLTYARLDQRSDRLARTLLERGVGPDVVVGVLVDRSVEMLVAILAVLKAGGAYLPLDPTYPRARIAHLVGDSRTRLVLARTALARDLELTVDVVDVDAEESYADDVAPLVERASGRDLAYVIYTSGSTGDPKGVMVEHRSVVNRLAWMQRAYPIGPGDVILQKTSISFDVSVWELLWWAATGATLALLEPGGEKDPAAIAAAIERYRVSTVHFVPSMLGMFLAHVERFGAAGRLASLRQVFTSGEELAPDQVRRLAELVPGARVVNLYGPTEATVDVTHFPCAELGGRARVPIGRPIDNVRLHVLDEHRRPVPAGVPGDLYIGGVGVARGYLRRPELTAERFVDDGPVAGERLYRTGDRVRWLPDGALDFLGRVDRQVKVRGFRVEPGEIEQRLRAHPSVRDAAVIATADGWQTSLHGFVVMDEPAPEQELKSYLRETLPDYMVPSRLLTLSELPLTPNGKLDRAALASPGLRQRLVVQHVPPRDERERALAAIWSEVLGVPRVGVMDNFFALGGNSIHFVAVLAKARAAGLQFTFQQLFRHQTVAALAAAIAADEQSASAAPSFAAERAGHQPFELISPADRAKLPDDVEDAYPLSMLQAGLIFQTEITGGLGQYHDVLGYLIRAPFDAAAFEGAVRELTRRHPVLRTTYHLTGYDEFLQLVRREVPPPLTVVDLRDRDRAAQERYNDEWVAREKARRFVWEEGGLVRFDVQIMADDLFRYTVSQHNSALDGWSISLLHTQLFELCFALREGRASTGRAVDNHLRNFVALEREAVASPDSRAHWARVLDDAPTTELPRRHGARDTADFTVAMHDVDLPAGLTERVVALADSLSAPVKDVLLAAHLKVLATVTGQREVLTGYEHSGRPELPDAEAALGLFLNTVPLRVRVDGGSWADLVGAVYQAELDLLPHRRYPMARMKQDLGTQRTLFETTFNYTHFYLLKRLRELPEFALVDMRVDSETEFVFRTEVSRHFFDDDIRLCLHYHSHLFDAEQIERIGGYFVRALELMTSEPSAPHAARPLSGAAEQRRLRELAAQGLAAVDDPARYRALAGAADVVAVHVLDDALQPAPLGSPGTVALELVEPAGRLLPTAVRGRWRPDGRIEELGSTEPTASTAPGVAAVPAQATPAEQADGVVREIAEAWARVLDLPVERIGTGDDFFALGGNSLSALRVVLELDGLVTLTDLTRHPRLDQLARLVERRDGDDRGELLHLLSSTDVGTTCALVCFPYPGGHPINFAPLSDALEELTSDIAVYGVEQPGHDPSHPGAFVDVVETARLVVEEIAERVSGPLLLWGHCGGAAVTVEVARQLEEQGFDLRHVIVGSKLLPADQDMRESIEMIEGWADDDVLDFLRHESGYTDLDGLPQQHTDLLARVFRHDVLGGYRYFLDRTARAGRRIAAPFTVVVAGDDPGLPHEPEPYGRWGVLAADLRTHVLEGGGHYFVRTNPTGTASFVCRTWDAATGGESA